jgi:hypothetical protein
MVYVRYNCWRHDTPITLAQKGFWILLALLIPMNPEEPLSILTFFLITISSGCISVVKLDKLEYLKLKDDIKTELFIQELNI